MNKNEGERIALEIVREHKLLLATRSIVNLAYAFFQKPKLLGEECELFLKIEKEIKYFLRENENIMKKESEKKCQ